VNNYFGKLLEFFDHMHAEGFLRPENRAMLLSDSDAESLIMQFEQYTPPDIEKWV
jgi:predicted Rossmann-fold nucleotide-binding protein